MQKIQMSLDIQYNVWAGKLLMETSLILEKLYLEMAMGTRYPKPGGFLLY
jgi:hypothetical protein